MDLYIKAFLALFAGLGAFLIGFKILSENIEKLANSGLKKLFKKTSNKRVIGVGIGALVTLIIQSSSAATVMVVGFVNAGVMDLFQATAMIMGANIGTTITAQIVALNSFDIGLYLSFLTFIGIFGSMIAKKEKPKAILLSLAGLGLVFIALDSMSASMSIFKGLPEFTEMLSSISNPFALLLLGMLFTALLQSSSAVTTIIISMVATGLVIGNGGNSVLYVILGSNIGTCITALLSSIGASANAKRASIIHLLFNVFAATIFVIILLIWPTFMENTFEVWFKGNPATQIAMFHTFFNIISTIIFLPFINVFVKTSKFLVKDEKEVIHTTYLDERFLNTPAIALAQVNNEVVKLGNSSMEILNLSIDSFLNRSLENGEHINSEIKKVTSIVDSIIEYLLKVSSTDVSKQDERYISSIHRILIDFTREVEIADNMLKYTRHEIDDELVFSPHVEEGIAELKSKLNEQFNNIIRLFDKKDLSILVKADAIEEEIDTLRSKLIDEHIKRLEEGKCSPSSNSIFISLVSNLERAGDHLSYISHIIMDK